MAQSYGEYDPQVLKKLQEVQLEILKDIHDFCEKHALKYFVHYGCAIGAVRHKGFIPWDDDIDICMLREECERFVELARADQAFSAVYDILAPISDQYPQSFLKVSKKGTRFVTDEMIEAGLEWGINVDIFPLDPVPKKAEFIFRALGTLIVSRLMYIYFFKYPNIPVKGFFGKILKAVCYILHWILRWTKVLKPSTLQRMYAKICKAEDTHSEYVDYYSSVLSLQQTLKYEDIFPTVELPFEDTVIRVPNQFDKILRNQYGDYMKMPPVEDRHNHAPEIIDFGDEK